jgi:hypothetical protein
MSDEYSDPFEGIAASQDLAPTGFANERNQPCFRTGVKV